MRLNEVPAGAPISLATRHATERACRTISDTFATEFFGKPVAAADNSTFPGARAPSEMARRQGEDDLADPPGVAALNVG